VKKKPKPKSRFKILDVHSRAKEAFDEVGTVRIYIRLVDENGRLVKGNVARSLTIEAASVAEVFRVVRGAVEDA
jgi:hypothetical protein